MAASLTLKVGDTDPALMLTASDVAGLLPVAEADKVEFFMENTTTHAVIGGVMEALAIPFEDEEGELRNLKYEWQASDTATAGKYVLEVKITWDESSTPDSIRHVPNTGTLPVTLEKSLG